MLLVDDDAENGLPDVKRYQTLAIDERIIPVRDFIYQR